jgi:hypothetical protein
MEESHSRHGFAAIVDEMHPRGDHFEAAEFRPHGPRFVVDAELAAFGEVEENLKRNLNFVDSFC